MTIERHEAAAGILDLASTWDGLASGFTDATPASSPCAKEATTLPATIDKPEQLTRAIAGDAVVYVSAAAQHLRALVKLLGPEIVLTGWSVTRALAEYSGRVAWLLSPEASPTSRVARFYMERIVSIHMARMSTDKIGEKAFANQMRREREAVLSQARRVFPDIALFKGEELNGWSVGGEPYSSLGGAVNEFGKVHLGANGLYDTLSSFTHPSLYRLRAQTTETQLGDRVHHAFTAEPDLIRWQLALAGASVYRAAHHVVGYLGIDAAPLEDWADSHPNAGFHVPGDGPLSARSGQGWLYPLCPN
jgi:hypothetical protein